MRHLSFVATSLATLTMAASTLAQSAEQLWQNNCMNCHGQRGQGGGAGTSSLLTPDKFGAELDKPFFDAIKNGVKDQGMEPFGTTMSDPQIWALVVHIRELQERHRRQTEPGLKANDGVYTTQHHSYRIETVVDKGLSVPWCVDWLPDGAMLIANRGGSLNVFEKGALSRPIAGTPKVRSRGQGGLMEVALHPDYAKNGWIYLAYSDGSQPGGRGDGMTKVVRGKIKNEGGAWSWTDEQTIFQAKPEHYTSGDLHFGCRIVFDGKGHVFFCIGERGRAPLAQDLSRPNGKVHRLNEDGSVPADNPFVGKDGAMPSVWSYGHRNPQGLVMDLEGRLWTTEHGPRGGDELNLVEKGANYGWPTVSYGMNYSGAPLVTPWPSGKDANITMPVMRWMPSIAACGLDVVQGEMFPKWKGDLVAGGLAGQTVERLRVGKNEAGELAVIEREEIVYGMGRVRDVRVGPDGAVYVVLNDPDEVVRLVK